MNIYVDAQEELVSGAELAAKVNKVLGLLQSKVGAARLPLVEKLATLLQSSTPLSYLASPTCEQIADCLVQFLDFIEKRHAETGVDIIPFGTAGAALLLTNAADVPYLLDAIQTALIGGRQRFQVVSHPILTVEREGGELTRLGGSNEAGPEESFIVILLDGAGGIDPHLADRVRSGMELALQVHKGHDAMMGRLKGLEAGADEENFRSFWSWLQEGNFLPLSYRSTLVSGDGDGLAIEEEAPALGLLDAGLPRRCQDQPRQWLTRTGRVVVEHIDCESPIHFAENLVYLGYREPAGDGRWREHAFFGHFTRKSIDELPFNVPALRSKVEKAMEALSIPSGCHDYRKIVEIFNAFPKAELFFMEPDELVRAVRSFTRLYRHGEVKVIGLHSLAVQGLTLLVMMPRAFYAAENMGRIEAYLCRHFKAFSASSRIVHISSDYLSLHISLDPAREVVRIEAEKLEKGLTNIARPWDRKLRLLLEKAYGNGEGEALLAKYRNAFSAEYKSLIHPRFALRDIGGLEKVFATGQETLDMWGPFHDPEEFYRIQFYSERESYLNELMPFLENLNLRVIDEVDFSIRTPVKKLYIKSFAIRGGGAGSKKLSSLRDLLVDALVALRRRDLENDYLNRLLVLTGLSWREIDVFRGYRNYYFQLGSPYTKKRVAYALINNPGVAELLYRYFEGRFLPDPRWNDPLQREEEALSPIRQELITALTGVADINEDNILRILFNLIDSTVRTNFFIRRNGPDYFFSFKISAIGIIDMPAPRPLFEVYVHSATMEGIHLRGGKVARGGIRWSDRPDDFRTEILGLMKTQMTKNALIVPVGSKGGFVVKTPFASREEGGELSKAAYQTLMRGLLDLTDNRVGEALVRPEGIVAYDEEDPYLVVAADKGTAHLPDTANAVSQAYGFWLDDAFASGGSYGYDHKKLGITARGGWESVKRHFREMGHDTQSQPFTVVGIGDMSGDVFGNGMLLSPHIRLKAAFDHRHIFLDPDPDAATGYSERQRLFALPRSSWGDYDKSLISPGGGVYSRSDKDIPLAPEIRSWLGVRHETMDAQGLIRLLLCAEVDLLWNGGIGTYFKAGSEKDDEVGDRANDAVRCDATALRARVVGEGGNLGFTQKARIEYALGGGRIYTDAVDNSAGVDCSDHEVNLKIFMQFLRQKGIVASQQERDNYLEEVTDDVCNLVLANNYGQTQSISLDALSCTEDVEPYLALSERLTGAGLLDRKGEALPTAKEVSMRPGRSLARPELAILMAYSKMQIYEALLESPLPDQEGARCYLNSYFPERIRQRFGEHIPQHPLAREITATVITNLAIDQAGSTFVNQLVRMTGAAPVRVVETYLVFDKVLDGEGLRAAIAALDNRMSVARQYQLLRSFEETLGALCAWALEHDLKVCLDDCRIAELRSQAVAFAKTLGGIVGAEEWKESRAYAAALVEEGLSDEDAQQVARLPYLEDFLPVVSLVAQIDGDLYSVAGSFCEVRDAFALRDVLKGLDAVPARNRWDRLAGGSLRVGFASAVYQLTLAVQQQAGGNLEAFFSSRRQKLTFYRTLLEKLRGDDAANYHPYMALLRALEALLG